MVGDRQCFEDSEQNDDWINLVELMNYNGVYRTSTTTPGLLISDIDSFDSK